MDHYLVLFNILDQPWDGWLLGLGPIIGLCTIVGAWMYAERLHQKLFLTLLGTGFIVLGGAMLWFSWSEHASLQAAFREDRAQQVEGYVHYLERGKFDRFEIDGVQFRLSESNASAAYNRTIREGNADLEGLCARAYYVPPESIVWLAVNTAGCRDIDEPATTALEQPAAPALPAGPPPRR